MKKTKMRGITDAKLAAILLEHHNVINAHTVILRDLIAKIGKLEADTPADDGA